MKLLILCPKGVEVFLAQEVHTYEGIVESQDNGCIVASFPTEKSVVVFAYMTQFASTLCIHHKTEPLTTPCDMSFVDTKTTYCLHASHAPDATVSSKSLLHEVHEAYFKQTKRHLRYTSYNAALQVYATQEYRYIGVRVFDFDFTHRDYRVFLGRDALSGITAAALASFVACQDARTVLDPLCQSGTIIIEAALSHIRQSVRFFEKPKLIQSAHGITVSSELLSSHDNTIRQPTQSFLVFDESFPRLRNAQKNARIAHVQQCITFSRQTITWIDLKAENVDCVLVHPDILHPKKDATFFANVCATLRKGGRIGIATRQPNRWITQKNPRKRHEIYQGKERWTLLLFA